MSWLIDVPRDLQQYYQGELLGTKLFLGEVDLSDPRQSSGLVNLRTAIVLSDGVEVPHSVNSQAVMFSERNNNLFSALFYESLSYFMNRIAISDTTSRQFDSDGNTALISLVDRYLDVNKGLPEIRYPLFVIYGHGYNDPQFGHQLMLGLESFQNTSEILDEIANRFSLRWMKVKNPLLLSSCNKGKDGKEHEVSHPNFMVVHRLGNVGGWLSGSRGRINISD